MTPFQATIVLLFLFMLGLICGFLLGKNAQ